MSPFVHSHAEVRIARTIDLVRGTAVTTKSLLWTTINYGRSGKYSMMAISNTRDNDSAVRYLRHLRLRL